MCRDALLPMVFALVTVGCPSPAPAPRPTRPTARARPPVWTAVPNMKRLCEREDGPGVSEMAPAIQPGHFTLTVPDSVTLHFELHAKDPNGGRVKYAADGLAAGAWIDPWTGVFRWVRPPHRGSGIHRHKPLRFRATSPSGQVTWTLHLQTYRAKPGSDTSPPAGSKTCTLRSTIDTLVVADVDQDGHLDVLYSDLKPGTSGARDQMIHLRRGADYETLTGGNKGDDDLQIYRDAKGRVLIGYYHSQTQGSLLLSRIKGGELVPVLHLVGESDNRVFCLLIDGRGRLQGAENFNRLETTLHRYVKGRYVEWRTHKPSASMCKDGRSLSHTRPPKKWPKRTPSPEDNLPDP